MAAPTPAPATAPTATVSISQFASDPNLLNTPLWERQQQILEDFWRGNYSLAVWALGRRSGKTLMSAIVATYAACMLADAYRQHLRPGERFYIISVANTIDQARIALTNVKDLINASPILKPLIVRETSETLELSNGAVFRAMPASSRGGRGMACPLIIFDEIAHALDTDGNQSGSSLYQALAPSVAQFGRLGKILMLSSPWFQQGIFWEMFKQASSKQFDDMQMVQAPSWEVNPTLSREFLEREKARDPELFRVEYGAEFSGSVNAFISGDLVDTSIVDRLSLPPLPQFKGRYYLSLDPAKGGRDAYVACIVHYDGDRFVVDLWHEFAATWSDDRKKQVNIGEVESWILQQHQAYGFAKAVLDQYNSQSTIQRLTGKVPIEELTWTAPNKTQAFSKLRELFNAGNMELYPHPKGIRQLKNLVVKYRANGTWDVSGGTGAGVDDYALSLGGAVLIAQKNSNLQGGCYIPSRQTLPATPYGRSSISDVRKLFG